ncbi:MAG: YihY/virulence factor BrkB family protein [Planctomycetes bacterium]|nr:YihY/virulence factor BrkB family protein [Planctomycetota bacterium]
MKKHWRLDRVKPGDTAIRIRNPKHPLRWLWAVVRGSRSVSIAGYRIRYTRHSEADDVRPPPLDRRIPGGAAYTIPPGGALSISLAAPLSGECPDGNLTLCRETDDAAPGAALPGDTVEVFDDRDNLVEARIAMRTFHPVDWLNALIWHTRTRLAERIHWIVSQFQDTGVFKRASSMAYNSVLVAVPFGILLLLLFARLDEGAVSRLLERVVLALAGAGGEGAQTPAWAGEFLERIREEHMGTGSTMVLFGLWSMVLFLGQVGEHLNEMRGSPGRTALWWRRLAVLFLVFPGALGAAYLMVKGLLAAAAARDRFVASARGFVDWAWLDEVSFAAFDGFVSLVLWTLLFAAYYFTPTVRPRLGRTLLASLCTSLLLVGAFLAIEPLTASPRFALFGPLRFVPVALFGCWLGWVLFFLGAFWAYADRTLTPSDPKSGAMHVRFGILLALEEEPSGSVSRIGERLGVDPAVVWSEALAMQTHIKEEGERPPVRVGLCSRTGEPRVYLENERQDLLEAALGPSDLLFYLHGSDNRIAEELQQRLRRAGGAIGPIRPGAEPVRDRPSSVILLPPAAARGACEPPS